MEITDPVQLVEEQGERGLPLLLGSDELSWTFMGIRSALRV